MTLRTKSQINKLGERLRHSPTASQGDARALNEFVTEQDPVRLEVETVVRSLCSTSEFVSSRLKTKTSILEKLRRDKPRLSEMQDIVGIRVVTPGNRERQDDLARRLVERWPQHRLDDRRVKPQHGYRALHVVVFSRARPVEIQIRTSLQHRWAELFEKLGDRWGREIRYGGPLQPEFASKTDTVRFLQAIASDIDMFEAVEQHMGPQAIGDSIATLNRFLDRLRKELLEEP